MKPIRSLTAEEFNLTITHLRLSAENVTIVRKILVEGVPLSLILEKNIKKRQTVEKVIKRVWEKFLQLQGTPRGWVSIRVDLPLAEAEKVKAREKELKQQFLKDNIFL